MPYFFTKYFNDITWACSQQSRECERAAGVDCLGATTRRSGATARSCNNGRRRLQPFPKGSPQAVRWPRCMACRWAHHLLRHAPCQHTACVERISRICC